MKNFPKITLFLLRISMGWLMFYAGITKILNPDWSALGYLENAQTFEGFYMWLTQPGILPIINFVNEWALLLLGVSLILGIFVRISSLLGAALMLLYYFPGLTFPYIEPHSFIVNEHIIYILVMLVFAGTKAGRIWSLDAWLAKKSKLFSKFT